MQQIKKRIEELMRVRDEAHAEIAELEKELAMVANLEDTPAADAVMGVIREREAQRAQVREERERERRRLEREADPEREVREAQQEEQRRLDAQEREEMQRKIDEATQPKKDEKP